MVVLTDDGKILVKFCVRDIIGVTSLVCVNCVVLKPDGRVYVFVFFFCALYPFTFTQKRKHAHQASKRHQNYAIHTK